MMLPILSVQILHNIILIYKSGKTIPLLARLL